MQTIIISDWVFPRRNYCCWLNFPGVSLVWGLQQEGSLTQTLSIRVVSGIGAVRGELKFSPVTWSPFGILFFKKKFLA